MRSQQPLQIDWARQFLGVFQGNDPTLLPFGAMADALNYEIYPMGQVAPRMGFTRVSESVAPDGKEVKTIYPANFDGLIRTLIATTDHIYELLADGSWNKIFDIVTTTGADRMAFCTLNEGTAPTVVWGNGKDHPQKWDGTTVTPLGADAPHGRPVSWKDYVLFFGIDGSPGQVHFAIDPGDPDTWIDSGGLRHYLETIGKITSIFVHTTGLLVFTASRTEIYRGSPDQLTSMDTLSNVVGCASHESVCDCAGYLAWVSYSGPMAWDGSGFFPSLNIGTPNDPAVSNIARDAMAINWNKTEYISGIFDPSKSRYIFSAKIQPIVSGAEYNRTWVYDFIKKTWMPWSLYATALAIVKIPASTKEKIFVGRADGAVLENNIGNLTGDFVDEGATDATNETYSFWAISNIDDRGDSKIQKMFRGFWFVTSPIEGDEVLAGRSLQVEYYGDFSAVPQTTTRTATSQRGFTLDVTVLADEADPTTFDASRLYDYAKEELFKRFKLRSKRIQFKIYGSGRLTAVAISAVGLEYRWLGRRLTPIA